MYTAGQIIKHLIAKHGPLTTNALATHISTFEKELVSKSHVKHRVLSTLEGDGVLHKKIYRATPTDKPVWRWQFTNESDATMYKELK